METTSNLETKLQEMQNPTTANTKLAEGELQKFQELVTKYSEIAEKSGQLHLEILVAERRLDALKNMQSDNNNAYFDTTAMERQLMDDITKKYGNGSVNLETGEFIPAVS
jgi:hypothetical protein